MKISELSSLTGINQETIRSYRIKGFLHPAQLENGYYDYSLSDYISLYYIRKMRGYSFSLSDISLFYSGESTDEIIDAFDRERSFLKEQQKEIETRLQYLELEKRHVLECMDTSLNVQLMHSIDDKCDYYTLDTPFFYGNGNEAFPMMTPTLRISKDVLNGKVTDDIIPMQAGMGTYRYIMEEKDMHFPGTPYVCPNGLYISQILKVHDLYSVQRKELEPMICYARKHNMTFISDTTGFLMSIKKKNDDMLLSFRIRACVKADGNSPA